MAALIRESTDSDEQKRAFAVQKDMVLEVIEQKNNFRLSPSNIFEELGKSGLQASDRPAFQLMCKRASQHVFDILVVDSVSRLARNIRELFDVIFDFQELGIGIIILKEKYWTYNMIHTDILRLAIDAGIAQAESMNTGMRVENHMSQLAWSGQLLGGDMFAYRLKKAVDEMGNPMPQKNSLVQEPIEAYTVKTIFELYTSDDPDVVKTSSSICKYLIELIERCKQEEDILEDGTSIQSLEEERDKLKKRLKNLQMMVMDELIDTNDFKEHKAEIDEQVSLIDRAIAQYEIDKAKREKKVFDLESIKERLNTFIDLKGYKVNEEMIDMFVERIIYRGIVNGNDEFLWVMNLSGEVTDTSAKYKIRGYDKAYSDSLMDDKNFNIVARMMIPMEECKRYCEKEANRKFRAKFWRPITIKIAIQ